MIINPNNIMENLTTPLTAPAYPTPPFYFRDREVMNIVYRTDYEKLRKLVPEPLKLDKDKPYVKFEVFNLNEVTGFGGYHECGQVIPCSFNGEEGEYYLQMYVDNFPAIASGRELTAYPKKLGKPNLYADADTLVGTLDYGTLRVATATMGYKQKEMNFAAAKADITKPLYMMKLFMGYDFKFKVCDLVRTQITDVTVKEAWTGPARLQLFEHVNAPLADLPVLEVISATHYLVDLQLNGVQPIYNYLEQK